MFNLIKSMHKKYWFLTPDLTREVLSQYESTPEELQAIWIQLG